jgi:TolA-binding protein
MGAARATVIRFDRSCDEIVDDAGGNIMSEVERDDAELDALLDAAAAELAADGGRRAGDEALIARAIDGAIARAKPGRAQELVRRRRWARRVLLLVAAMLVATSGALALIERARTARRTPEQTRGAEAMPGPSLARPLTATPRGAAKATEPLLSAEVSGATLTHPSPSPSVDLTAQELFAQANETRRHGEAATAVRQYLALQRRFPRSPEASLSLVALGRLYLDRLGDPPRALAQFDQYVAGGGTGELREEALVGRALVFQQLRKTTEEKGAWRALLAAYPNSLSASRAVSRLAELH